MNKIIWFFPLFILQKSLSRKNLDVKVNNVSLIRCFKPNYVHRSIYNQSLQ